MSMGIWFPVFIASLLSCYIHGAPRLGENCDLTQCGNIGQLRYYQELNCRPIYGSDSCCPIKFDCSSLALRSSNKCHFKGEEYELKSEVTQTKSNKCLANCRCSSSGNNRTYFNCAHVECPESFQVPLKDPSCVRQYSHDFCCSVSITCPNNKTLCKEGNEIFQCDYEGRKYYKGQKFFPKGECKTCICEEGYDGTTNGPWCEDVSCNVELIDRSHISQGCVPVYYTSTGCCPVDWRCPSESDTIIQSTSTSTNITEENDENRLTCKFGNLQLASNDQLSHQGSPNIECTCTTPPHITCIMKASSRHS